MLLDLSNIISAATEISRMAREPGFEFDDDLFAEIRTIRETIIHL